MFNFWEISDTGKISISITQLYEFLNRRGYRKEFRDNEIILYKITNQFIDLSDINALVEEIIRYLKVEYTEVTERTIEYARKEPEHFEFTPGQVLEAITKFSFKRIFDKVNWNYLRNLDVTIKRHTSKAAYFYFKNAYVEITKDGSEKKEYDSLPPTEKIFAPLVISREMTLIDINNENQKEYAKKGHDFFHFLSMISSNQPAEPGYEKDLGIAYPFNVEKLEYLMRLLGYCLHDYKEHGKTDFATLFCDENIGGTGKGTIAQAISQLIDPNSNGSVCEVDGGKTQEKYDPVELNVQTRLKIYNDITRPYLSNSIYNEITDSATIRQMHSGSVRIPYAQSWKIMVLANFTLSGGDGHLLRRFKVYYMTPFFHRERNIRDYYGHTLFGKEWEEKDWNYFYNVLFECVSYWLDTDYRVNYDDPDYTEYKLASTYFPELREYIDSLPPGFHKVKDLYDNFRNNSKWSLETHIRAVNSRAFAHHMTNYLNETRRNWKWNHNRSERWLDKLPKPGETARPAPGNQMHMPV